METELLTYDQLSFLAGLPPAAEQVLFNLDYDSDQLTFTSFNSLSPSGDSALSSPNPFFVKSEPTPLVLQRNSLPTSAVSANAENVPFSLQRNSLPASVAPATADNLRRFSQESAVVGQVDPRTRRLIKNVCVKQSPVEYQGHRLIFISEKMTCCVLRSP
jgi:hypothetical protein